MAIAIKIPAIADFLELFERNSQDNKNISGWFLRHKNRRDIRFELVF